MALFLDLQLADRPLRDKCFNCGRTGHNARECRDRFVRFQFQNFSDAEQIPEIEDFNHTEGDREADPDPETDLDQGQNPEIDQEGVRDQRNAARVLVQRIVLNLQKTKTQEDLRQIQPNENALNLLNVKDVQNEGKELMAQLMVQCRSPSPSGSPERRKNSPSPKP